MLKSTKHDLLKVVNARQKAEGGSVCYFATPKYCLTLDDLLAHAEDNHERCKRTALNGRRGGMLSGSIMKHASDLRIHAQSILDRAGEIGLQGVGDYSMLKAVKAQANRTYRMKT